MSRFIETRVGRFLNADAIARIDISPNKRNYEAKLKNGDIVFLKTEQLNALFDTVPNHRPELELWCVWKDDHEGDGIRIEIFPIIAWRIRPDGVAHPVTYDDAIGAVFSMVYDPRQGIWTIPGIGGFTSPEAMLNNVYMEVERRNRPNLKTVPES